MPSCRAICRQLWPCRRSRRISWTTWALILGRPWRLPFARAFAMPVRTHSEMSKRSNSAIAEITVSMVFSIEGGVDLLSDGKKADAQVSKLLECVDELLGRAREAVEFPDQNGIRFPNTYACHNRSSSGRSRVAPLTWLPKAS